MLESASRAWIEVDFDAIAHNLDEVQKLVGNTKIMGIVKANAYGHGAVPCARAMEAWGVDFFGVSSVDEALELREAGIESDILILGYTPPEHFHYLAGQNLVQSLVSNAYAHKLDAWAKENGTKVRAHAKLDTGMNRTGVIYQKNQKHFEELKDEYLLENVQVEGIFSHFPVSDDLEEEATAFTRTQIALFEEALSRLREEGIDPGLRHIQNSYGILNYGDLGYDYCRPGLLYMGVTSDDQVPIASNPDFIPILSLYANVSLVKQLEPGATVSYGRHFTVEKPMTIATLSIGYADGLPRLLSNQFHEVILDGHKMPLLGNICMDQCMVDATGLNVQEGDRAILIGQDGEQRVTVDEISRKAGTINNETLTRFTARVPRLEKRCG